MFALVQNGLRHGARALAALALIAVSSASAAPAIAVPAHAPAPAKANVPAGQRAASALYGAAAARCTVTDPRLAGLSGLAATGRTMYAASDQPPVRLFALDTGCRVSAAVAITVPPVLDATVALPKGDTDVEDLGVDPDGSVWIADIGGNRSPRQGVSLLRWPGTGTAVTRFDLRYPDGTHDAEALLVSMLGQLLVVTKSANGHAAVYAAPRPLRPMGTMSKVGEIDLVALRPKGQAGPESVLVTGGAVAPDGVHFALRTYAAAYEWDAPDGDLVQALRGKPRVIALGPDKQGEAIAYSPTGRSLLTAGEKVPGAVREVPIARTALAATSTAPMVTPVTMAGGFAAAVLTALLLALGRERRRWASRATTYQANG